MSKMEIIPGSKYGRWTVVEEADRKRRANKTVRMIKVICDCGVEKILEARSVLKGHTKQCRECRYSPNKEFVGKRFGKLVATEYEKKDGLTFWVCKCDCGNSKSIRQYDLKSGNSKSCGCSRKRKGSDSVFWQGAGRLSGKKWADIRHSAEKRSIEFSMSIEDAWALFKNQNEKCALSGQDISIEETAPYGNASLDRIDSSSGYIIGNVQWVHKDLNLMKQSFEQDYFVKICKLVVENFNV